MVELKTELVIVRGLRVARPEYLVSRHIITG